MQVVGLDLSLTATGYCSVTGETETLSSKQQEMDRIRDLTEQLSVRLFGPNTPQFLLEEFADLVVIEDYAFSRGGHAHEVGELGGVVKNLLIEMSQPYVLVGPSSVKKFATNKGNANKIEMGVAAAKLGQEFGGDDNRCDAWWLREMALYRYGAGATAPATAYRDEVVSKIAWPVLQEQVA